MRYREIRGSRLRHRRDEDRPFLVFSTEIRSENLKLLEEVRVGVDRRVAVAARIGTCAPSAVMSSTLAGNPFVGKGIVQWTLTAGIAVGIDTNRRAIVVRLVRRAVGTPKPGTSLMYSAALLPTWVKFCNSVVSA